MGFFSSDGNRNLWIERLAVDTGNWFHVFSACLGKMMAVQTACSDQVVKGQDWNIDFEEGSIRFGAQKYPLQFIGSESTESNTWLWGWENINGFSEEILRLADHTKEVGDRSSLAASPATIVITGDHMTAEQFSSHFQEFPIAYSLPSTFKISYPSQRDVFNNSTSTIRFLQRDF